MKRASVVLLTVAVAAAGALLLVGRRAGAPVAATGATAPRHHWIVRATEVPDAILCDFVNTEERLATTRMWLNEPWPCSLGSGWTTPDSTGLKAIARSPSLDLRLPAGEWSLLVLTARAFPHPEPARVQTLTVRVNEHVLAPVEVPAAWTTLQLPVPPGTLREGVNRIAFSFGYRVREAGGKDPRLFAMTLSELLVTRDAATPLREDAVARLSTDARERRYAAAPWNPGIASFELATAGTLVLPMVLPADADRIELDLGHRGARAGPPEVQLRLRSLSSEAAVGPLPPAPGGWLRRVHRVVRGTPVVPWRTSFSIRALAGDVCMLTVDVAPRQAGEIVRVSAPRVIRRGANPPALADAPSSATEPGVPPDIVVIVLDAARADRLSCYGYERPTTPAIDRLAAESLVFRRVFALAPYTLCSVPTMVTGLSFLDHGVVAHGDRLSADATTLAEHLKSAGYRTACVSASPNNSRAIGTDQGYDDFIETWRVVARPQSADPFLVSRLALDWLAADDGTAPIHLQLHYVPPHAPYAPPSEFDLFTDPAHRGRVDGSHASINALDAGALVPRPQDLDHVRALYDGNLRAGDAAVAQVLQGLEKRPRWRDTVVLVTADHGEAFLEHGRMSHNSTVFDEMLHVPFVLRLPTGRRTSADLDRLASLADIVPTLLATAGARHEDLPDGLNLLAPPAPGARFLIARTAGEPPLYALRTSRWKLVFADSGMGALFDLAKDPGEARDLSLQAPLVFSGLGQLLTERLSQPPRFTPAAEPAPLSEANAEMLKALGYVH
jgi:arylsulfatase A-like enzyme